MTCPGSHGYLLLDKEPFSFEQSLDSVTQILVCSLPTLINFIIICNVSFGFFFDEVMLFLPLQGAFLFLHQKLASCAHSFLLLPIAHLILRSHSFSSKENILFYLFFDLQSPFSPPIIPIVCMLKSLKLIFHTFAFVVFISDCWGTLGLDLFAIHLSKESNLLFNSLYLGSFPQQIF